ncbi:Ras-related protein Rab-1A [Nematocida displodere]|uniref:Ras-related protein Rab-1A n=1 Tax=Nematocida displodere TaxID=1805483 RepID=A0A177EIS8_9MICR|nr:Ras-related protein Rab-1A [Nematocida displodere]
MGHEEYTHLFKILVVGSSGVGKTCLLLRCTESIYKEVYGSTIGVDFKMKTIQLGSEKVKLQLWDTAGQERFRTITSSYYRNAQGIILVFDITDRETFTDLKGWISEISNNTTAPVVLLILGNKIDEQERMGAKVTRAEVEAFIALCSSDKLLIKGYREVSAKTGEMVAEAFEEIAQTIKQELPNAPSAQARGIRLETDESVSNWCC